MMTIPRCTHLALCVPLLSHAAPLSAQQDLAQEAPIATLLEELGSDVRAYDAHVTFLANPFMEGRLPGTRGMEIAKEYVEAHYNAAGLARPCGEDSYRQPFGVGRRTSVAHAALGVGPRSLVHGEDFGVTGMGSSGSVTAPVAFCGYGIERGVDGFRGFPEGTDLEGKIAMVLRFEPMDENGKSLWSKRGPWTSRAGFSRKLRSLEKLGARAVIMVNTPGADDERVNDLMIAGRGSRSYVDVPVLMIKAEAAESLLSAGGFDSSLMDLRRAADQGGVVRELGFEARIDATLEENELTAENVIGLLRGKGTLAEEYVVLGAHLDHLGMGNFGSREGSGKLHPGADDNASGSAAVIMLAERMVADYGRMPEGTDARSVIFMCFSAEESGLIGSSYYCKNPLFPIEQHKLMINFDMIGRIVDKRLSVSGAQTGEGMEEWLEPYFEASQLTIVQPENMSGASDHTPFYRAKMPVLFGIIADFHDDYHTSRDVVSKINRVDAVNTIDLFHEILRDACLRAEIFPYKASAPRRDRGSRGRQGTAAGGEDTSRGAYLGVTLKNADGGPDEAVVIDGVVEGEPAAKAGLQSGDRILKWNGKAVEGMRAWREMLQGQKPGDKVQVTVDRGDEEKVLWLTLGGRSRVGG